MPSPLSEEESLFYSTVRRFAEETIAPLVRAMDDEQQFAPGLNNLWKNGGLLMAEPIR
jgi:alkylation response protein AidB-like acyl-CoA dehydrogenase